MTYQAPNIPSEKHCFFGRRGGVSTGRFDSLNCNIRGSDSMENIRQNLQIIAERFHSDISQMCLINQGVTNHAVYIETPSLYEITADGLVTDKKGLILSIKTADCCPVLLADYKNGIIGAAHAGWRGALRGIVENTLKIMLDKGAEKQNISAALGPCLQQPSFEAGEDMLEEFIRVNKNYQTYFSAGQRKNHYQFNLERFVVDRLREYGITDISASGIDTYANEQEYFSFRRETHKALTFKKGDFPNHLSTITL